MDLAEVTELTIDSLPGSRSSFWASHSDKFVSILSGIGLENPVDDVSEIKICCKELTRKPPPKLTMSSVFQQTIVSYEIGEGGGRTSGRSGSSRASVLNLLQWFWGDQILHGRRS